MDKKALYRLINTKVGGRSMENYIADMLDKVEKGDVEVEKIKMQNAVLRQYNSHHREVNASYRIEVRDREATIEALKVKERILEKID